MLLLTTRPQRVMAGGQEQHRKMEKKDKSENEEGGLWKILRGGIHEYRRRIRSRSGFECDGFD